MKSMNFYTKKSLGKKYMISYSKKFHLEDSTVYLHIRKYSIPTRQIGNFVYVPKKEIDNLYKGMKQ